MEETFAIREQSITDHMEADLEELSTVAHLRRVGRLNRPALTQAEPVVSVWPSRLPEQRPGAERALAG
jgi:hypothetical protein